MRKVTGQRLRLKHYPFPFREKGKKEYIIGEALLRWKGIPEDEVATLRNDLLQSGEFDYVDMSSNVLLSRLLLLAYLLALN